MGAKGSGRKPQHVLLEGSLDLSQRSATCVKCGPVRVYEATGARKRVSGAEWVCGRRSPIREVGGRMRHALKDVDVSAQTATCELCGPVRVEWRPYPGVTYAPAGRWVCAAEDVAELRRLAEETVVDELTRMQNGACAVCDGGLGTRPRIDRGRYGEVRSLMCIRCRNLVRKYESQGALLAAVARYLGKT